MTKYVSVLLDKGIKKPLTYSVPIELQELIEAGQRVFVPVQKRSVKGTILNLLEKEPAYSVKEVEGVISKEEVINEDLKKLAYWMSDYYATALPFVLKTILPGSLRKDLESKKQYKIKTILKGEKLLEYITDLRAKHPGQAEVLDVVIKEKGGIFPFLMTLPSFLAFPS